MIVVFDAECLLCSAWVRFLLKHDRAARFRFASIQGEQGKRLLRDAGLRIEGLETLLLVDGESVYRHTDAILRVLKIMGMPWRLSAIARIVPASLRDRMYRFAARNRYRFFGRRETCYLPKPEEAWRFLD